MTGSEIMRAHYSIKPTRRPLDHHTGSRTHTHIHTFTFRSRKTADAKDYWEGQSMPLVGPGEARNQRLGKQQRPTIQYHTIILTHTNQHERLQSFWHKPLVHFATTMLRPSTRD
jgi:hypothetical protein